MRRGIAIGTIVAGMLTIPASAAAYNLSVSADGTMTVTNGGSLRITFDGLEYEVGDTASSPAATPPCSVTGGETASCPAGTVARINATATLGVFMNDNGGPDAVEVPSSLTMTGFNTQVEGGNADDLVTTTYPDPSKDVFIGGPGNDTLRTGPSYENLLMDELQGGPGNDVLDGGVGPDLIDGGPGTDRLEYPGRTDAVSVTLPEGTATRLGNGGSADGPGSRDTLSELENVTGGSGADSLTGNSLANLLSGGAGNDTLDGGAGPDTLAGGAGTDTVDYSTRTEAISATLPLGSSTSLGNGGASDGPSPRDRISGAENLTGGSGRNSLTGNSLANVLLGGLVADRLGGGGGPDRVTGGGGADAMLGQKGIDKLFARDGQRDKKINCGPGKNRRERATRDRRDPPAKSC